MILMILDHLLITICLSLTLSVYSLSFHCIWKYPHDVFSNDNVPWAFCSLFLNEIFRRNIGRTSTSAELYFLYVPTYLPYEYWSSAKWIWHLTPHEMEHCRYVYFAISVQIYFHRATKLEKFYVQYHSTLWGERWREILL